MAHADDTADLQALLDPLRVFSAEFEQLVTDVRGDVVQMQTGTVALQKPGRFRWNVVEPFPQLVIANGSTLYVYDPDLEQLTIQPLDDSAGAAPVVLLSESRSELAEHFDVFTERPEEIFVLVPKASDALFREVRLRFKDQVLEGIDIVDHLEQVTRIEFQNVVKAPVLESSLFEVDVPPGTDVIGDVPDRDPPG